MRGRKEVGKKLEERSARLRKKTRGGGKALVVLEKERG